jgi:hypothetical protein
MPQVESHVISLLNSKKKNLTKQKCAMIYIILELISLKYDSRFWIMKVIYLYTSTRHQRYYSTFIALIISRCHLAIRCRYYARKNVVKHKSIKRSLQFLKWNKLTRKNIVCSTRYSLYKQLPCFILTKITSTNILNSQPDFFTDDVSMLFVKIYR